MTLEQKLAKLQNGKPNSISLEFNDHWAYYGSVEEAVTLLSEENWLSDEDRQKCIETNSLWVVRWYERTPSSHLCACGSSLDLILDYLLEVGRS